LKHLNKLKTPKLQVRAKTLWNTHRNVIRYAKSLVDLEKRIEKESHTLPTAIIIDEQVFAQEGVGDFVRTVANQAAQGFVKTALGRDVGGAVIKAASALAKKKPKQKTAKPLRHIVPPPEQPKKQKQKPKYNIQILRPDQPRDRPGYQLRQLPSHYHHLNEVFFELMTEKIEQKLIIEMERYNETIN
jgi:hypothetical protein